MEALDPRIEWTETAEFPGVGSYHGHVDVQVYLSRSRKVWAEGSSEPERFIVAGDKIIVLVHVRVRPKDSTEWHEMRIADVFTFRKRQGHSDASIRRQAAGFRMGWSQRRRCKLTCHQPFHS